MKSLKFLVMALFVALMCVGFDVYADAGSVDGAVVSMAAAGVVTGIASADLSKLKMPEAQFQELKAKFGKLYVIDVKLDDDESYQFVVKRPTRTLIEAVSDTKDITKMNDMVIKNMVVGGDVDALDDGLVYAELMKRLGVIMKSASGFLSKA